MWRGQTSTQEYRDPDAPRYRERYNGIRYRSSTDYISRAYSSTWRVRNTDAFEPRVICRNDRDAPTESRSSSQMEPVEIRTNFSVVTASVRPAQAQLPVS